MGTMTSSLRRTLCLLCLLLAGLAARAQPAQPLQLNDRVGEFDAWKSVTMLADPDGRWQLDDVLQRRSQFSVPGGALSNLGVRREWCGCTSRFKWRRATVAAG
jgi:hypothetical protein